MNFRIIAIKPLKDCNNFFLKNLKIDELYSLVNDYSISKDTIQFNEIIPFNFFTSKDNSEEKIDSIDLTRRPININVSAIVGKNGSGKSALIELFLKSIFYMWYKVGDFKINWIPDDEKREILNDIHNKFKNLNVEIYIEDEGTLENHLNGNYIRHKSIYKLHIDSEKELFEIQLYKKAKNLYTKSDIIKIVNGKFNFSSWFYTICINYSHYAFNSNEIGKWIKTIFHKNDSYQMPIVLNPYRKVGNIDINSEIDLVKARLLVNLFSIEERHISNDGINEKLFNSKIPYNISFKIDRSKFSFNEKVIKPKLKNHLKTSILKSVFEYFRIKNIDKTSDFIEYTEEYIVNKVKRIAINYYKEYLYLFNGDYIEQESHKKLDEFIYNLSKDESPITWKLRQAIVFWEFPTLRKVETDNFIDINSFRKRVVSNYESSMRNLSINDNFQIKDYYDFIYFLPPSFFKYDIQLFDTNKNAIYFNSLSSGEKQKIFSISSLIYHIKNIDSYYKRSSQDDSNIGYRNINIIFDEIELYYHPDFQKEFVNDLITIIESIEFDNVKNINVILVTHSPFILSDIPTSNILYLKDGKPKTDFSNKNSFGANITDLLAESFFIKDGLIGDFAKNKIQKTIDWLNKAIMLKEKEHNNLEFIESEVSKTSSLLYQNHKKLIKLVDEPMLKIKLAEMYDEATEFKLEKEILINEKIIIEERLKRLNN